MSTVIKLRKGENINLTKNYGGQKKWKIGLSWAEVPFDLDVIALALTDRVGKGGKCIDIDHLVGYMNATDPDRPGLDKITFRTPSGELGFKDPEGAIMHFGDCRDGSKAGDDEVIKLDFDKLDPRAKAVLILVNIYDIDKKGYNFGRVQDAMANLYQDDSDISTLSYELSEDYSGAQCLEFVEFYLHNDEWKMSALGEGNGNDLEAELKKFGIPV